MKDVLISNKVYDVKWKKIIRKGVYLGYRRSTNSSKPHVMAMRGIRDSDIIIYGFPSFCFEEDELIIYKSYPQRINSLEKDYVNNLFSEKGI
jgi:hypothetical protein